MTPTAEILGSKITKHIYTEAIKRLDGRALACANNAIRFLVKADQLADVAETVSYFCVTHATEEAVACVVAAAKDFNYKNEASKINPRDHFHKATVAQFAQMASGLAEDVCLEIALHQEKTDRLLFKARPDGAVSPIYGILSLPLFSFNPDASDPDGSAAFERFSSLFSDEEKMVRHIKARANYRNDALYAKDGGTPAMTKEALFIQLHEHTLITIGLIWAALDMSYHDEKEPFVLQILSAITRVCDRFKNKKLCSCCDGVIK